MADREKVINDLQDAVNDDWMWQHADFYALTMQKAISLLQEQEPVLLKNQHKPGGHFINANSPWKSKCPRCGKKIEGRQTRFCKYCGQAVKWDD